MGIMSRLTDTEKRRSLPLSNSGLLMKNHQQKGVIVRTQVNIGGRGGADSSEEQSVCVSIFERFGMPLLIVWTVRF